MLIKSINWIITDACNLRCKHCDIWKLSAQMTDSDLVEKLLADPVVNQSYNHYGKEFDISLGGGEPFAHPKLQDIVTRIDQKYKGSLKAISTNGVLTKKILRFLYHNSKLNFKLNMSIDGLQNTHDQIRGVPGAFNKTIKTIRMIKQLFPRKKIEIKMTIMRDNFSEIHDVYSLSQELGCSFSCKQAENMKYYTNRHSDIPTSFNVKELCSIRNQLFPIADKMRRTKEYKKSRFTKDLPFHLSLSKKHSSCSVLWEHITVMVNGDIFFCIKEKKAGNITKKPLEEMRTKIKNFKCKSCMLMCGSFKDYTAFPYREAVANVEATLKCNLACDMCTQKELQESGKAMKFTAFATLIQKYHLEHVSFIGGESFTNPEFFRMTKLLDTKGITYELTTNGTLFTEENKKSLKKCIGLKKINFSLDGLEKYHDSVRGKGVFKKAIKALLFSQKFFNVSVASIVRADNLSFLPDLCKFLKAYSNIPHKFIYAMDISDSARQNSLAKIPRLEITGPKCDFQVKNFNDLKHFFHVLEDISSRASYEPKIMRNQTKEFLKNKPTGKCKQLNQLRFDPYGKKIICEFIRNVHNPKLQEKIKKAKLSICIHCCKMDY